MTGIIAHLGGGSQSSRPDNPLAPEPSVLGLSQLGLALVSSPRRRCAPVCTQGRIDSFNDFQNISCRMHGKEQVFDEAFRVLKSGGRLAVSDIINAVPLSAELQSDPSLLCGWCRSGRAHRGLDAKTGQPRVDQDLGSRPQHRKPHRRGHGRRPQTVNGPPIRGSADRFASAARAPTNYRDAATAQVN